MKNFKHFLTGLLVTLSGVAVAATFNQFGPANGVLKGNANTPITTAAVSADIRGLWSGLCDATTFLRGDGSCAVPVSTPAGANTQVQFNNGGIFGADSDFTWNVTTNTLTLATVTLSSAAGSVFGAATGGAQGAGTVNATGVFINGVPVGTGSGSVSSVALAAPAIFTVSGSPVTTMGTLTLTAAGTSGGIPYFDSATSLASSGALTASRIVLGGGAGGSPTVLAAGTTTTVLHGNAAGAPTFAAVNLAADVTGTLPFGNGGTGLAAAADDTTLISSGSAWVASAIPNCVDTAGNHLNYTTATNALSCGSTGPGGFTGFANPTASVGLTAVNGSAVTAMRSDAAPALSQTIVPTWTGTHTFTAIGSSSANTILMSSTLPLLRMTDTDAVTDAKDWQLFAAGNNLTLRTSNEANNAFSNILVATRSGSILTDLTLGNSTDNNTFTFSGTGTAAFGGNVTVAGQSVCRANGTNCPGTFTGFANPTASVGLTAVNGSATTAMRSDGAPPLSQSISPTWTGTHTFSGSGITTTFAGNVAIGAPASGVALAVTGSGATFALRVLGAANSRAAVIDSTGANGSFLALSNSATEYAQVGSARSLITSGLSSGVIGTLAISSSSGDVAIATNGVGMVRFTNGGGTLFNGATGGQQGAGTLNAAGVFVNGVAVVTETTTTATGTATGCTTAPTGTLRYVKQGNMVTLSSDGVTACTSNSTSFTLTGAVPAGFQPARTQQCMTMVVDNGVGVSGRALLSAASSTLTLRVVSTSGDFTNSGSKSWDVTGATCSYILN